jgi:ribosomal protein S18 acetylase RimI-like enzyme
VDGEPAGMLAGQVRQGRTGHVAELAVARGVRRRGVGSLLLGSAFAAFAERGLEEATLSVRTANVGGVRLYERAGMTVRWRVDELAKRLVPT